MIQEKVPFIIVVGVLAFSWCIDTGCSEPADADKSSRQQAAPQAPSQSAATKTGQEANITRNVSIVFAKPKYGFTVAQAAKGISIEYTVVVKRDIPDIIALPQDEGASNRPDPSGLIRFEKLFGNKQLYGLFDIGLAPPVTRKSTVIRKGSYRHKFSWDGRNWRGGSDTSRPKGAPFPPGKYTLEVSFIGQILTKEGRDRFRIQKQVEVKLVK